MLPFSYFDAHCDTLSRCAGEGWPLWENPGQLDLKRLSAYPDAGQVFALYLDSKACPPAGRMAQLSLMMDLYRRAKASYPREMAACSLSLEGGELINCDASQFAQFVESITAAMAA